ncbi:MAG: hypothetical protein M5R40_29970 [Anaerolineae bacterium]|nr:hypothetical protein [Anaerolineae bacterium]
MSGVSEISQAALSTMGTRADDLRISADDRAVLRRLAARVAELAARPIEQEKRTLWYRHNALEPTRPLVFCDPEVGWQEIITPNQMECTGALARDWEFRLRKEIFWGAEMCDDRVIVADFDVPHVYQESDWGCTKRGSAGRTAARMSGTRRSRTTRATCPGCASRRSSSIMRNRRRRWRWPRRRSTACSSPASRRRGGGRWA